MEEYRSIAEYELIGFDIELCYQLPDDTAVFAGEEDFTTQECSRIVRDASGIPMGQTIAEIKERETIIKSFFRQWIDENPERRIYNDALEDYIWVKGISVIEAKEHSAKSYRSTQAIMMIGEVLKKALPVRRMPTKKGNKNQSSFAYMLIMVHRDKDIGTIKLTIGVKSDKQNIEYGISALQPGQPLIDDSKNSSTPKKKKRKQPK